MPGPNIPFSTFTASLCILVSNLSIIPQTKRGFYCGDPKIDHKYTGDTITGNMLYVSVVAPAFLIWIIESIHYKPNSKKLSIRQSFLRSILWIREYFIAVALHMLFMEIVKVWTVPFFYIL